MNPALVRSRQRKTELALREQRPCTLLINGLPFLAREGVTNEGLLTLPGASEELRECKFYVLRELMDQPPVIGTVFEIESRPEERWTLQRILSGKSPSDPTWCFECDQDR